MGFLSDKEVNLVLRKSIWSIIITILTLISSIFISKWVSYFIIILVVPILLDLISQSTKITSYLIAKRTWIVLFVFILILLLGFITFVNYNLSVSLSGKNGVNISLKDHTLMYDKAIGFCILVCCPINSLTWC